jgi:hypothetical protein
MNEVDVVKKLMRSVSPEKALVLKAMLNEYRSKLDKIFNECCACNEKQCEMFKVKINENTRKFQDMVLEEQTQFLKTVRGYAGVLEYSFTELDNGQVLFFVR